ncbi:uncharacterized protein LOC133533575 isoform X1 [Cydia pomonella]|uniref:uncharacterized protein LOC133533575 isoform X1 n=1 Tax=Cydia pomonella TaxID=82600 RepID=UPI002ADE5546|nr:uncharacterized protein LOC133533575 isoform X1 [Cydia pomonella]
MKLWIYMILSIYMLNMNNIIYIINNIFKKIIAPKLTEAQLINVRFARLRVQVDRFTNKANAFDVVMASQMSDCQENVTQMQYNVETIKERIDDHLAHPAEDPVAVAAIKEEFADMQFNLVAAKNNQMELTGIQEQTGADLTRIKKRLEMIGRVKTTREEALEALQYKARVVDVNGLLSREQLCAVVGFLQGEIHKTKYHIESGEINWQACIDDFIMTTMNEKCDRVQALTLNNSLRDYYRSMNAVLNTMLNIVGDYPVNLFKKKMDRDGNCLSCGTAADTKVSDKYMELARRMIKRQAAEIDDDEIPPKPCVPGRPIPHPVDPRALVCERYCGASVSKTEESLSSSLGLDVTDINPTHVTDMRGKVNGDRNQLTSLINGKEGLNNIALAYCFTGNCYT